MLSAHANLTASWSLACGLGLPPTPVLQHCLMNVCSNATIA
jgi:hypothetical protein